MNFNDLVAPIDNLTPTHLRKAILWGPESLLMDAVAIFLKSGTDWEVIKICSACGGNYLLEQIESVQPTVVVLCQERDAGDVALLAQLSQVQHCSRVVAVSMESNLIQIYSKQNVVMHAVADLLSVVDHELFSNSVSSEEVRATKP